MTQCIVSLTAPRRSIFGSTIPIRRTIAPESDTALGLTYWLKLTVRCFTNDETAIAHLASVVHNAVTITSAMAASTPKFSSECQFPPVAVPHRRYSTFILEYIAKGLKAENMTL